MQSHELMREKKKNQMRKFKPSMFGEKLPTMPTADLRKSIDFNPNHSFKQSSDYFSNPIQNTRDMRKSVALPSHKKILSSKKYAEFVLKP